MKRRRVKITGIGPVTPAGIGREEFWNGILEPVSRVRPYGKFGDEFGSFVAAQVSGDMWKSCEVRPELPKGSARHTQFAVCGALLALKDAQVSVPELRQLNCAIVTGSSLLDFGGIGNAIDSVHKKGLRGVQRRVVHTTTLTAVPEVIGQICGITARTMTTQTSCCAGIDAIGRAAEMVASGEVDFAICGGTESPLHRFPLLELRAAGLTPVTTELCDRAARPFDLWRTTGVVSEGACMFILEAENSPREGYCFVSSHAFASDPPGHLCGGLATAAKLALAAANIRPSDVDCINAWGPGHTAIDASEASAMISVFGDALPEIAAISIKGAVGSALGAAPAIQVGMAALAQRNEIIPPTVNWERPDPACPFNLSRHARAISHRTTLVNAHGVGSVNSCLVLDRC